MMRRIVPLGLVGLVVATGVWGYLYVQGRGQAQQYRRARIERGPLTAAVSATGSLNAVTTVQVGSQVSGQIKELLADFNTVVRRGQIIARIDPAAFEAKVNQVGAELEAAQAAVLNQQAQVERSRADLENVRAAHAEARAQTVRAQVAVADARRDLDRKAELARRQLIARSEHDTAQAANDSVLAGLDAARAKEQAALAAIGSAQAQLRVAEAQLTSARAQVRQKQAVLRQAEVDLQHTKIRAPVDGVVVSRQVDVGQTVAASLQAPVLFTIAQDLTEMQVDTSVDEADIGRIGLDAPAVFNVDAFPGRTFTGRVVQIRKAAQVVQNVVTYTVVVAVDNPDGRLLPGMTANVKVIVAQKPSVLKVPSAALRFRPPGDAGDRVDAAVSGGRELAGRPPSVAELREELVKGLTLTPEQQARLEAILEDSRQQMAALRASPVSAEARQQQLPRIRETTRAKIRELLSPGQQVRYDELTASERRGGTTGRVFVLGPDGKPAAIPVTLGLSDGSATEILGGDLAEGQEVLVGQTGGNSAPSRPGGGGGPRLRF
jgi:HlyD family secretion protein